MDSGDDAADPCGGWSPTAADPRPWVQVDLGASAAIDRVDVWEPD